MSEKKQSYVVRRTGRRNRGVVVYLTNARVRLPPTGTCMAELTPGDAAELARFPGCRVVPARTVVEHPAPAVAGDHLDDLDADGLRAYAEERGIDLGRATRAETLREKIRAALE